MNLVCPPEMQQQHDGRRDRIYYHAIQTVMERQNW